MGYVKKTYKKKSYSNKNSAYSVAKQALYKVNKIQKQVEHKYFDTSFLDATAASTGVVSQVFDITQGTTDSTRVGDKCYMTRLQVNLILAGLTGNAKQGVVRHIVVKISSPLVGTPTIGNILEDTTINSLYKRDSPYKYKVLSDNNYKVGVGLTNNAAQAGQPTTYLIKKNYKLNCTYDNDGTQVRNGVWSILIHDCTTEQIYMLGKVRVNFTDM